MVVRRAPYVLQKLLDQYSSNSSTLSLFLLEAIALPSLFMCLSFLLDCELREGSDCFLFNF